MRILQVANFVSPQSGGIRTALAAWARRYQALGHEVTALVPEAGDDPAQWWPEHPDARTTPGMAVGAGYRLITAQAEVMRLVDRWRPDVIELSDRTTLRWLPAWAASRGIACVMVAHEHVQDVLTTRGFSRAVSCAVADLANMGAGRRATTVVTPSRYAALEPARVGVHARVVPLGVDIEAFHPRLRVHPGRAGGGAPGAPGTPGGGPLRLVHVGRLSREKRPWLSIETLRALLQREVDAELVVLGSGPLAGDLERRAAGLPVEFLGHRPRAQVAETLANADVALAPAPAETFGLGALEAMACGTPVVCSDTGALPEVVGIGGSQRDADPRQFAAAARALAADPVARERARRRAVAQGWHASACAMLATHAEAIARLAPPRRVSWRTRVTDARLAREGVGE
ncbi:glycosyltransferase family 4 protein [Serinibacter salmoneus]|uniref:D-inositol 3-phosphate glycosyltransferase n=1 Tax=Serinibacter salmoneus TaxID=556530 RepID=A0A2A9CXJ9_9MICO|nr:glycosyltransferase family 4 protein [Serinibacter salmoneus]PFG19154.1 alpha-1,6-mannosyltransferase [Serinibacter salmoneus]